MIILVTIYYVPSKWYKAASRSSNHVDPEVRNLVWRWFQARPWPQLLRKGEGHVVVTGPGLR